MTELRRRMDDAMIVRGFAVRTRETYLDVVKGLAKHYRRSPEVISDEEIQARATVYRFSGSGLLEAPAIISEYWPTSGEQPTC